MGEFVLNLQVLLSTMNQTPLIHDKMRITTDCIIINQCETNDSINVRQNGTETQFYSFAERGIGRSRNTALMRATADICLFADDDVVYNADYEELVLREFDQNKKADVIIFNVKSTNSARPGSEIRRRHRVRSFNCLRYGAFQFAVRRERIWEKNIWFSLLFGGGARFSCGEDSLFLWDCIRRHLRVYASPTTIGIVTHAQSSWFSGFSEKYFIDRGYFYRTLSAPLSIPFCLYYLIKNRAEYSVNTPLFKAFNFMIKGINT